MIIKFVETKHEIGDNLYIIRRKSGKTQAEVAELAGLSDRAYADIERGTVNMRVETLLRICNVLNVTPNDILIIDNSASEQKLAVLFTKLNACPTREKNLAISLLEAFLDSI